MNTKASSLYRNPNYRLNCAQVLVYKWCECNGVSNLMVDDLRGLGSGRAPDGMCGALYGAIRIFEGDEIIQDQLSQTFKLTIGECSCKGVSQKSDFNCHQCIDVMDEAIEKLVVKSVPQ